jgi:hypothetical protein
VLYLSLIADIRFFSNKYVIVFVCVFGKPELRRRLCVVLGIPPQHPVRDPRLIVQMLVRLSMRLFCM